MYVVCTYFLLANIVVFGFGRKNKHVMPELSYLTKKKELKAEYTFHLFFAFLEKPFNAKFLIDL